MADTKEEEKDEAPSNMALRMRGTGVEAAPTNMALRMRGTTVQDAPDDTPTPSGQGGIGSDAVADQIMRNDDGSPVEAHAKGGVVGDTKARHSSPSHKETYKRGG
jgi:hypothetical protein